MSLKFEHEDVTLLWNDELGLYEELENGIIDWNCLLEDDYEECVSRRRQRRKKGEEAEEAAGKWNYVIRDGKKVKKLICPPGYKAQGGRCVKMTPQEIMKRKLAAKKAAVKIKTKAKQIARKRRLSMRLRGESLADQILEILSCVAKTCVCPKCGYTETVDPGIPCNTKICPECGTPLVRPTKQ